MNSNDKPARPPRRVLVTGSRTWVNPAVVREALRKVWGDGDAVLVTGASPRGADRMAEMFWRRWGGQVERHPAEWDLHGNRAGYVRNQAMVGKGADICVAFVRDGSPGASNTVQISEHAGIPVRLYTHDSVTGRITAPAENTEAAPDGTKPEARAAEPEQRSGADTSASTPASADHGSAAAPDQEAGSPARVWLDVPYGDKDAAKNAGARWDRGARRWYAPDGITEDLARWTPEAAPAGGGENGEPSRLVLSPERLAATYSYPELRARIARLEPGSAAHQRGVKALALLCDDPDLYRGKDHARAIARDMSPEDIQRDRARLGSGPLFNLLGQAAQVQHDAEAALADVAGDPGALERRAADLVARGDYWLSAKALHDARQLRAITPRQDATSPEAGHPAAPGPRPADTAGDRAGVRAGRVWLDVPYKEKDTAKAHGARWDRGARRWYAPDGITEDLSRWAPGQRADDSASAGGADTRAAGEPGSEPVGADESTPGAAPDGRAAVDVELADLSGVAGDPDALERRAAELVAADDITSAAEALRQARELRRPHRHGDEQTPAAHDTTAGETGVGADCAASVAGATQAVAAALNHHRHSSRDGGSREDNGTGRAAEEHQRLEQLGRWHAERSGHDDTAAAGDGSVDSREEQWA